MSQESRKNIYIYIFWEWVSTPPRKSQARLSTVARQLNVRTRSSSATPSSKVSPPSSFPPPHRRGFLVVAVGISSFFPSTSPPLARSLSLSLCRSRGLTRPRYFPSVSCRHRWPVDERPIRIRTACRLCVHPRQWGGVLHAPRGKRETTVWLVLVHT